MMNAKSNNTCGSSPGQSKTVLKPFRVMLYERPGDEYKLAFDCDAEDPEDAAEQAELAYRGCEVISCTWFDYSVRISNR